MKDSLNKEVFEVHMKYTQEQLMNLRDLCAKINVTLDQHEKTLMRNTITVEEHHRRSTHIEERQNEFINALNEIVVKLTNVQSKVDEIETEIQPIKMHTDQVNKMLKFLMFIDENKSAILKVITFLTMLVAAVYVGFTKSGAIDAFIGALK